jgi:hypothetical protein
MAKVDYNPKNGRFVIFCPPFENGAFRTLPSRRWDARQKAWTAPAIRVNVDWLEQHGYKHVWTLEAIAALRQARDALENKTTRHNCRPFPSWYRFKREPRLAQRRAFESVYGLPSAALFMDMRTGKTKAVIDMACAMRMEDLTRGMLLVCPINCRRNWLSEFQEDGTIPYDAHLLRADDKGKSFERWLTTPHDFKVLLVGFESLSAGSAFDYCKRFLTATASPLVVLDESQNIKTHNAIRTKKCWDLGRMAAYRIAMTGTPQAKNPMDLYAQYEFLDPDIIGCGDFYAFRNRYAVMGGYEGKEIIGYDNLDELFDLVAPFTYQVRQADAIDVPEKTREIRAVPMGTEQARVYKQLVKEQFTQTEDGVLVLDTVLARMQRLHQVAGGHLAVMRPAEEIEQLLASGIRNPERFITKPIDDATAKVAELLKIADERPGSMLVWCAYKPEIRRVVAALREKYGEDQVVEVHGDIDEKQRHENVRVKFQGGHARFLVGNAQTGGVGLTMSRAQTIVYYSSTFALLDRLQSEERGTGGDKTEGVHIIDLLTEGTVDFHVYKAGQDKRDFAEWVRERIAERVPFERLAVVD